MKRRTIALVATPVALLAVLVGGALLYDPVVEPEVELSASLSLPTEPAALEAWVTQQEERYEDIVPGAEKHILWADPEHPGRTRVSLVYLHGFSACRQEVSPLTEQVAAELGANVFFSRLRGHGRTGEAMLDGSVQAWAEDGHEALEVGRVLGEQVVLVGTSTGGTLAAWLAASGADVDALVLISPNFGPRRSDARVLLWPGRRLILRAVQGTHREFDTISEEQARYWTERYPAPALFPMMELVGLVERTPLDGVTAPTLFVYSPDDQVVNAEVVPQRAQELGSDLVRLVQVFKSDDPQNHVIAGRIISPSNTDRLTDEVVGFLGEAL